MFVDVGDEGEPVACGLELVFYLVGDFCGAAEFEGGGFSAGCPDLDDAFVVAAGDAGAAVALFAGPDDFDFLGGFEGDAVEGAGDEDGCDGAVDADVGDVDCFLDVFDVFVDGYCGVDEVFGEFVAVDLAVGPDAGGFGGAAGGAAGALDAGLDGDPDCVFDAAVAAEFAVFTWCAAFGAEA